MNQYTNAAITIIFCFLWIPFLILNISYFKSPSSNLYPNAFDPSIDQISTPISPKNKTSGSFIAVISTSGSVSSLDSILSSDQNLDPRATLVEYFTSKPTKSDSLRFPLQYLEIGSPSPSIQGCRLHLLALEHFLNQTGKQIICLIDEYTKVYPDRIDTLHNSDGFPLEFAIGSHNQTIGPILISRNTATKIYENKSKWMQSCGRTLDPSSSLVDFAQSLGIRIQTSSSILIGGLSPESQLFLNGLNRTSIPCCCCIEGVLPPGGGGSLTTIEDEFCIETIINSKSISFWQQSDLIGLSQADQIHKRFPDANMLKNQTNELIYLCNYDLNS